MNLQTDLDADSVIFTPILPGIRTPLMANLRQDAKNCLSSQQKSASNYMCSRTGKAKLIIGKAGMCISFNLTTKPNPHCLLCLNRKNIMLMIYNVLTCCYWLSDVDPYGETFRFRWLCVNSPSYLHDQLHGWKLALDLAAKVALNTYRPQTADGPTTPIMIRNCFTIWDYDAGWSMGLSRWMKMWKEV